MNAKQPPKTVDEMYPSRWLKAADLGKPVTVTIERAAPELIFNTRTNEHEYKTVVSFFKCQKRLILNKTQNRAIEAITGTGRFNDWQGHQVTVAPGQAPNKKPTIVITAPPPDPAPGPNTSPPMTETQAVQGAMIPEPTPNHYQE